MPRSIQWLDDGVVDEVSGVDLAANRKRFRFFKGYGGHGRIVKDQYVDAGEPVVPTDMAGNELPAPLVEEGVLYYPWYQAIQDLSIAYSEEDAPRIAGLLLAKYGEGPYMEIKLPAGADVLEEAAAAIKEGESLMSTNPLLRTTPRDGVAPAKKNAALALLKELGLDELLAKFRKADGSGAGDGERKRKEKDAKVATITDADREKLSKIETLLRDLAKGEAAAAADAGDEEEDQDGAGDGDDHGADGQDDGADAGDGDGSGDEGGEASGDFEKNVTEAFQEVAVALGEIRKEIRALQAGGVQKRRVGASRGAAPKASADERASDREPRTYRSMFTGEERPFSEIRPYLSKRSRQRFGLDERKTA